jgi:UDP-glucose:(heptosyl)LPS alpha-1,3-glucosyltransferase
VKLAFCLFRYFPFGGMQKSFRAIAEEALRRGHALRVYAHRWQGEPLAGATLVPVPLRGLGTPARQRHYVEFVRAHLAAHPVDLTVGFDRVPGLDVHYAADDCLAARLEGRRGAIRRALPRYRHLLGFERAVFASGGATRIMFISGRQRDACLRHYPQAAEAASTLLPPGIAPNRMDEAAQADARAAVRRELGADGSRVVLLAIGSGFRTKGLERTLRAIAALPPSLRDGLVLAVAGQGEARPFLRLAQRLGLGDRLRMLGGRDDVPRLLAAGDLLLHPARSEAAGAVLLEAGVAGVPVLASGVCGFAPFVAQYGFGRVMPEPFSPQVYARTLREMLEASAEERARWRANGRAFGRVADVYGRARHAVDFLEAGVRR